MRFYRYQRMRERSDDQFPETSNKQQFTLIVDLRSDNMRIFRCPFSVKMVFSAGITIRKLMRPQLEHALTAGEEPLTFGKNLRPTLTLIAANIAFHEGWI